MAVVRILVIFQHTVYLCSGTSMESSHRDLLNDMAEHRPILKNNQNTLYSLIFQNKPIFSHINMESTRRDLLNDMAEHRPILKNNQNTLYSLIFQDRPMFCHSNGKLSPRPFE